MTGAAAVGAAVLIWASYPVATRAGVTGGFSPLDLLVLRFGIGAVLLLPYLVFHLRSIPRKTWMRGFPLTLFQGAGMGALVIFGLQFAPANHAAALGPGVSPAWVAILGFLVFARRPEVRAILGALLCAIGVVLLAYWSASATSAKVIAGDAMFLAASALGALYVLQLRNWGVEAIRGAAIVSLYSALVVVPWYLCSGTDGLRQAAPAQLLWQILWQGVLIGCVALIALNHAVSRLGAERTVACIALVPVLSAVLSLMFLGEVPSITELVAFVAISVGVSVGASLPKREVRPPAAQPQSALPAGYPVRDSAT